MAACLLVLGNNKAQAQEAARPLLRLVPEDFGIVLIGHDLRAQFERWEKSPWLAKIQESPLARSLVGNEEWAELRRLKRDLQTHLGVDWPTLRDDVLGDAVLFAFRPERPDGNGEEALFLLKARKGGLLSKLLERINAAQKKSGELKDLEEKEHVGVRYFRRVHEKNTQYYFVRDGLFALSGHEATLKSLIAMAPRASEEKAANLWTRSLKRGAVPQSFLTLIVNPRAFDEEFKSKGGTGAEDLLRAKLGEYWTALAAVVLNVRWEETLEVRLGLLGKSGDESPIARRLFLPIAPNPLWPHLPEGDIFALTGRVDLTLSEGSWGDLLPPVFRKQLMEGLQRSVGALVGLDLESDLLPNIGPDWGLSVFASKNEKHVPQVLFAIAARPGNKGQAADQALFKGLQLFATLAAFDYNRRHADPIHMKSLMQGGIEVRTLVNAKAFPEGFQPAFALKDGYLLLASSPEGILRFAKDSAAPAARDESLLLRLSATELNKQLGRRRDMLVDHLAASNAIARPEAERILDGMREVLALFDRIEMAQTAGRDQMTLILRVIP